MKKNAIFGILALGLIGLITLLLSEVTLRVFFSKKFEIRGQLSTPEDRYWDFDSQRGWRRKADTSGTFTNGYFEGIFHSDADGNRKNSKEGTFREGYQNFFFIGDSTVASLEVDDEFTVPALFEKSLRRRGKRINVINLGVRGYGTDQSVLAALEFAQKYQPVEIFYLFEQNDTQNNNVVKTPYRYFGKGMFQLGKGGFVLSGVPVRKFDELEYSYTVLDHECQPRQNVGRFEREIPKKRLSFRLKRWLRQWFYTYRALRYIGKSATQIYKVKTSDSVEPYLEIEKGVNWSELFPYAHYESGVTRIRCEDYFYEQTKAILSELRKIPSLKKVHVLFFPHQVALAAAESPRGAPSSRMFQRLLDEKVIDSFVDLPRFVLAEGKDTRELRCPEDGHFCEKGNEWIVSRILASF